MDYTDNQEKYSEDKYSEDKYPETRYPETRYPETRYPETRYPETRYPENRYSEDEPAPAIQLQLQVNHPKKKSSRHHRRLHNNHYIPPSYKKSLKKRSLSNIERFYGLKESFNQLYQKIVEDYLVNTIHYDSREKMERLQKSLYDKFIHQSRPTGLKGEIQYMNTFLQSMKSIFECFYEKYMAESSLFLLRHPALLKKRIDMFIDGYVNTKKYKIINKKTRKQICETISYRVQN